MKHTDLPADTRIMGIVHSALRRDLARAVIVLDDPALPDARRIALAGHLDWMMDFLLHHHASEDNGLYPLLLAAAPGAAQILAEMDAEHQAVHPAMDQLHTANTALAASADARLAALDAVRALNDVLDPHLAREETELMPLVAAHLSAADWDRWDQDYNLKGKSPLTLAQEGFWLMDGTTEADYQVVAGLVPPLARFVILRFLGGRYRRLVDTLWAGTPAAQIGSLSLASLGDTA